MAAKKLFAAFFIVLVNSEREVPDHGTIEINLLYRKLRIDSIDITYQGI